MAISNSKRVTAFFLAIFAFILFCCGPLAKSAEAVVIADDAVLLIIIAALAAMGITFEMSGGIRTVLSWLAETIDEAGLDFSGIRYGANKQGQILINNRFLTMISTLALYIQAKLSLTDNDTAVISQSGTIAGYVYAYRLPLTFTSNNGQRYVMLSSNPDAYVFFNYTSDQHNRVRPIIFAYGENDFTYHRYQPSVSIDSSIQSSVANGGRYVWDGNNISVDGASTSYSDALNGFVISSYDLTVSNIKDFLENNVFGSGIETTQDLIANTSILDIPDSQDIGGKGGIITLPVDWGTTLPGIIREIPGLTLTDELAGNSDLEIEEEGTVADQISEEATNAQVVSQEATEYQAIGLQNVFPFCIPFDIYAFFECLAADPVAPVINWRFYVPGIVDETITIDLSQFNTVAQVLRTMELLAFIIGLAFVTREKFLRG